MQAELNDRIDEIVRKGLLYDPEAWATMVNQMAQADAKFSESLKPVRKGLLNDPEAWARFINQTTIAEAKAIDSIKIARNGLFYDSQKWSDYLKQSMVLNATTMRTSGEVKLTDNPSSIIPKFGIITKTRRLYLVMATIKTNVSVKSNRQPLLYHPEEWDRAFDPAMVHIGRKSAIGTVISRQSPVRKLTGKYCLPVIIL